MKTRLLKLSGAALLAVLATGAQAGNITVKVSDTITRCLHLLVVAKSLERIADHATNIAEEVVYLCEAQDIRHADKTN